MVNVGKYTSPMDAMDIFLLGLLKMPTESSKKIFSQKVVKDDDLPW